MLTWLTVAEAPEHQFLSRKFLEVLDAFSTLKLYGYTEADRRRFDFACVLRRDWNRPLVGQTLWKHAEGVDKDIRLMLTDDAADLWCYIMRDTVQHRALLHEVVSDYRRSDHRNSLFKLRVFWVPHDFDADRESQRTLVGDLLTASIVQDLLFHVVFGNLTGDDIRFFLNAAGMPGLNLALLHHVAVLGFENYPGLSKVMGVSSGPLRERILTLVGSGFLWQVGIGSLYYVSLKGRVFLELLDRIITERARGEFSDELIYIMAKLGMSPDPDFRPTPFAVYLKNRWTPQSTYAALLGTLDAARKRWELDLARRDYKMHEWETNPEIRIQR